MEVDGFTIEPLTPDRFADFVTVLGEGGVGGCWCMYWTTDTTQQWRENAAGGAQAANKELMRRLVDAGPPPGLIAYDGDEPVAWCRVVARATLPGLKRSTHFSTDLDTDGVWSLPCFVVRRKHRGRGLTGALTTAAAALAATQGATVLEAYPWDAAERKDPASIWTGVASTFRALGFHEVQRKAPHKPMMRLDLEPPD